MKARFLIIPLMILAACQPMDQDRDHQKPAVDISGNGYTLTLKATKVDAQTKALDLSSDGATLGTYWKSTEKVKVFRNGTCIGTLNVAPGLGDKPKTAVLSGTLNSGVTLSTGDVLTLLLPRETWNYSGQTSTLTGTGSIEDTYDFAMATVTIDEINGTAVTTTADAQFQNQQSIYRFGFMNGTDYINIKNFTISAANGKLVQSVSYQGGAWTSGWGNISVTPASTPSDHFYYVSLRNDATAADTYSFIINGTDKALYMATKDIPTEVLDAPGRFISAKTIDAVKTKFTPSSATTISSSDNVY